jgi:hypothetical protein
MGQDDGAGKRSFRCDLPILLIVLMGNRYFGQAPLFIIGAAISVIVAIALLVAAFGVTARNEIC